MLTTATIPIWSSSLFSAKLRFFEKIGYKPHAKQLEVHLSPSRFKAVAAGARAGKSMLAGAELAFAAVQPNRRCWCVGTEYSLADKEFDWSIQFLASFHLDDGRKLIDLARLTSSSRGSRLVKFPWGSFIQTKSAAKPRTLLGEELDLIVLSEGSQLPKEVWQRQLYSRLGPRKGGALSPSTPNTDMGLQKLLYDWGESDDPKYKEYASWKFSVLANPTFDRAEYEKAKATLPKKVFLEQYEGEFVSIRGHVFDFHPQTHTISQLPDNIEHWQIVRGFQRGYTNNQVFAWIAVNPENRSEYIILDSHYSTEKLIPDIAPDVKNRFPGRQVFPIITDYGDLDCQTEVKKYLGPAAVNNEQKYSQKIALIRRIQALQNVLKIRENGKPRLLIYSESEGNQELIKEFQSCKWPDPKKEEAERLEDEVPLDKHMQGPKAVSYPIAWIEKHARGVDIYTPQKSRKTS